MAFISAAWFVSVRETESYRYHGYQEPKTTTTYLVKSILENAGYKSGTGGNHRVIIGGKHIHANNTTPESGLVTGYFARMVDAGLDTVVMEVSSQALMLHRTQGFVFDYGILQIWSRIISVQNEHASFEEYLHCKGLLFKQCKVGIVNGDDEHWQAVTEDIPVHWRLRHGRALHAAAEEPQLVHKPGELGVTFHDRSDEFAVEVPMPGKFSVCTMRWQPLPSAVIFKVDEENNQKALLQAKVKGRIEMIKVSDQFTLLIDYAA